ncbi:enhanced serine sensitivity protein SseB C-terminal domain-containing protein [Stenotrophomonas sp. Ste96]|uniref:enhanced serine sensitivity protein SseB C-terminal domain-containing protein n=1 Tax=Stenotrophomonas sp. Ste96 TaxID=2926029 RepID=UPI0021C73829|nr:enhanced serine sensitivity protein SseB C-terminal domain-containing protein [Stenotrophomonas sp. Ste96]
MQLRLTALAVCVAACAVAWPAAAAADRLTLDDAFERVSRSHPDLRLFGPRSEAFAAELERASLRPAYVAGSTIENALGTGDASGLSGAELTLTLASVFERGGKLDALPFFTSQSKAAVAAGHSARIVTFTGRELLEMTRGATLMLNPNDGGAVLYPEEIESLLTTGAIAPVRKDSWTGEPLWWGSPDRPPSWLIPVLTRTLTQQKSVTSAYLIQTAPEADREAVSLLIVLGVAPDQAERAARACMTSIHAELQRSPPEIAIDLTLFDPIQGIPDFVTASGVEPFYQRGSHP